MKYDFKGNLQWEARLSEHNAAPERIPKGTLAGIVIVQ